MGRLRELDRSVERRWPWLAGWENVSTAAHARFVMALLAVGMVASSALSSTGNFESAWGVAVVTGGAALGATFALQRRLALEHPRGKR